MTALRLTTGLMALAAMTASCDEAGSPPSPVPPAVSPPELGAGEEQRLPDGGADDGSAADDASASDDAAADVGEEPPPGPFLSCDDGPFFPVRVGNSWTFEVRERRGITVVKINRVAAEEPIPVEGPHQGRMAFRFETLTGRDTSLKTVSWQAYDGGRLVRYAERQFSPGSGGRILVQFSHWEPYRTRFDEGFIHFDPAQSWPESYLDVKRNLSYLVNPEMPSITTGSAPHTDHWAVQALDEEVVVPAGRFKALRVRKLLNSTSDERGKTYWFARCVGKVKEIGLIGVKGGQDEFLTSFSVQL